MHELANSIKLKTAIITLNTFYKQVVLLSVLLYGPVGTHRIPQL